MPCKASCIQQQSTEHIGGKKLNSLITVCTLHGNSLVNLKAGDGLVPYFNFLGLSNGCNNAASSPSTYRNLRLGNMLQNKKLTKNCNPNITIQVLDEHIPWNFFKKLLAVYWCILMNLAIYFLSH